ncbi:InlB B-repeat-containing protein [Clostridium bowmanii]|uniref:InlB B-repeat-containing protein n=1 Tax=Clostridium bowmanii TaxID=132925 RepID=UPI001C0ADC70|nr:InlB B-repeat-containing protein [Clostridium bowmanii]MBU3191404.1 InlB B-repeat-containing protein [Clostridium bowmanii]MCA1075751.1 InlB B-repeat-containing protein [Clostridium bowmanii]
MKKFLVIAVSLMLLFFNIPLIVSAASDTGQPTITLSQTKVKIGDIIKIELEANNTLSDTPNSNDNVILIRSRVKENQTISLHPSYNENTKKYELEYTIPSDILMGEWYIEKVVLQDNAGNSTYNYSDISFTVDPVVTLDLTVEFDSQGGSTVKSDIAYYNATIKAPSTPIRTGYVFGGWYKEAECLNAWDFTTDKVTENITLYSKWTLVAPGIPKSLKAASSSYNSINVNWGAVVGADGYEVYSSTSNTGEYTLISTTTKTSYNNTGLVTNSTYYYKVRSYKMVSSGKVYSDYSIAASSKPILGLPINVMATRINSKGIKLSWSFVAGANAYEIYRATTSTGTYSLLTKTIHLDYTNSNLITGKTYYYKVRAYRTIGNISVYSNLAVATNKTTTYTVFNNLVQPNGVYGKYAGLKVEILDQSNNKLLIKKANGTKIWVSSSNVSIGKNPTTNAKYLDKKQLETYVNITSNFISDTKYFTWVDLNRQRVSVFTGSAGNWALLKTYSCASGNNSTPSKRGFFTVQDKGNSFTTESGLLVKYWTRFSGNYLLHSTLLTASGNTFDATVGTRLSHGCIRMPLDMAKWYYEKIPAGSLIWVN